MKHTIIVFARKPELGKVKTRLAKVVGKEKALSIYSLLLENALAITKKVNALIKIYWTVKKDKDNQYIQQGDDLGERMYNALKSEVTSAIKVCLVGTDTPQLSVSIIEDAFQYLDNHDIVFGPSKDGGYYLIALQKNIPESLFIGKKWSHQNVLIDAINECKNLGFGVKLLPTLLDIDTVEDYNLWKSMDNA